MEIDELKKYAKNLEFTMKENEYVTLQSEFEILFKQMELIGKIEGIKDYEPMDFPFPLDSSYLREDEVTMSLPVNKAFSNSDHVKDNCIETPKVVA